MEFDGGNHVEQLRLIMPPPVHPLYLGSDEAWLKAEQLLGHVFPRDYRSLLSTYGLETRDHAIHSGIRPAIAMEFRPRRACDAGEFVFQLAKTQT